jgi:hypothetical protein
MADFEKNISVHRTATAGGRWRKAEWIGGMAK